MYFRGQVETALTGTGRAVTPWSRLDVYLQRQVGRVFAEAVWTCTTLERLDLIYWSRFVLYSTGQIGSVLTGASGTNHLLGQNT